MFERELLNSCNKVKFDTYCGYSLYLISLYTYSFGWPFLCPTPATKFIIFLFVQGCRLFRKSNKSQITHKCVLKKKSNPCRLCFGFTQTNFVSRLKSTLNCFFGLFCSYLHLDKILIFNQTKFIRFHLECFLFRKS